MKFTSAEINKLPAPVLRSQHQHSHLKGQRTRWEEKKNINKWQWFARPDHLPVCTPADARGVDAFLSPPPPPPPLGAGLAQCSQGERSLPTLILGRCPRRERFCGRVSNLQPTNFNTFRWWGNVKCIFCPFSPRLPRMIKLANQKSAHPAAYRHFQLTTQVSLYLCPR